MSNLVDFARTELRIAQGDEDLAVQDGVADGVLEVVAGFAEQGHSGGSAAVVGPRVGWIVGRLLAFEPITPLTGAADEWTDVSSEWHTGAEDRLQQNRRCPTVFRELGEDGWVAFAVEQVVWTDRPRGEHGFTGWDSARRIEFPWTPGRPRRRWKLWRRPITLVARLRGQLRP